MSETTPFWQEVRGSLMVRGDGWKPVIEDLPNHLSAADAKSDLQSPDQLTFLNGVGYIAGGKVVTELDKEATLPYLNGEALTLENIALQWLYRFIVVEALVEHNRTQPMAAWSPMFLHLTEQGLHFMVYMAALLVLIEEKKQISDVVFLGDFQNTEAFVKERVREACAFLHPKAQDYGESFRRHGLPGILPRLWDKIARYAQLRADNRAGNFEKKEDSARDLLGYSLIAYSLMLELPKELRESYQPTSVYETESNVMAGAEWKKVK
jgi:hypothetical protein